MLNTRKHNTFLLAGVFSLMLIVTLFPSVSQAFDCGGWTCDSSWDKCGTGGPPSGTTCSDKCCADGGGGDDDSGPICPNGVCEAGENQQNCCYDCGTPCDGTATNVKGDLCPSCPGGSCFCGQCQWSIYQATLPDGTEFLATAEDVEQMKEDGQEFTITAIDPNLEVLPIICPAYAAEDIPTDVSSQPLPTTDSSPDYIPPDSFVDALLSPDFHQQFLKSWTAQPLFILAVSTITVVTLSASIILLRKNNRLPG